MALPMSSPRASTQHSSTDSHGIRSNSMSNSLAGAPAISEEKHILIAHVKAKSISTTKHCHTDMAEVPNQHLVKSPCASLEMDPSELIASKNAAAVRPHAVETASGGEMFVHSKPDSAETTAGVENSSPINIDAKIVPKTAAATVLIGSLSPKPEKLRPMRGKRKQYDENVLETNVIGLQEGTGQTPFGSPGRRRRINEDPTFERNITPIAKSVEFDHCFLTYAASSGGTMKEKLVWHNHRKNFDNFRQWMHKQTKKIADVPKRSRKKQSRVGPMYQSRISKSKGHFRNKDKLAEERVPCYDRIWDPKQAETAQKQGQDISGFLKEGGQDLCTTEFLMKVLHENKYNLGCAQEDIKKVQQFRGIYKLVKERDLEDDWCAYKDGKCVYADDEHTLIVCNGCGRAYHPACANLPGIPTGDWLCPVCYAHLYGLPGSADNGE